MNMEEYRIRRQEIVDAKNHIYGLRQEIYKTNSKLCKLRYRYLIQFSVGKRKPNPNYIKKDKRANEYYREGRCKNTFNARYTEYYEIEHLEAAREMKKKVEEAFTNYTIYMKISSERIPCKPQKRYRTLAEITKRLLEYKENDRDWEPIDDDGENRFEIKRKNKYFNEEQQIRDDWTQEILIDRIKGFETEEL
jgi:hypothetical protein